MSRDHLCPHTGPSVPKRDVKSGPSVPKRMLSRDHLCPKEMLSRDHLCPKEMLVRDHLCPDVMQMRTICPQTGPSVPKEVMFKSRRERPVLTLRARGVKGKSMLSKIYLCV